MNVALFRKRILTKVISEEEATQGRTGPQCNIAAVLVRRDPHGNDRHATMMEQAGVMPTQATKERSSPS